MKKIFSIVIPTTVLIFTMLCFNGCGGSETSGKLSNKDTELLAYENIGGVAEITGIGAYPSTDLIIPEEIGGLTVVSVGEEAFANNRITSVIVADTVTEIKNDAFEDCESLTSVKLGKGLTRIYDNFSGCDSLTAIYISDLSAWCNIDFDGGTLLSESRNLYLDGELVTNLIIPNGVTRLNNKTFSGYERLVSVTIPDSVTEIGNYTFSGCINLETVTIPDTVSNIGESAFYECASLNSFKLPTNYTYIHNSTFEGCTNLTTINMPASVEYIGERAFAFCENLESVNIPKDSCLKKIDEDAFRATGLTTISLPKTVTYIGVRAFGYCSNLSVLQIAGSDVKFEDYAFEGCDNLTSAEMPDSIKYSFLRHGFDAWICYDRYDIPFGIYEAYKDFAQLD